MQEGVYAKFIDGRIHVNLADGSKLVARANICATGVEYSRLGLPNESRFVGSGLYYDAGFSEAAQLRDKSVYIVGGANSAGQAAMHFCQFATKVTMLVRGPALAATMSDYMIRRIVGTPNIEVRFGVEISALQGERMLESITIRDRNTKSETTEAAKFLFICIGGNPNTEWARNTDIIRDTKGYLVTGTDMFVDGRPPDVWPLRRHPLYLETSVPGSFAAGDVRHNSVKRYATAVGEGAMAATFVHRYLAEGLNG